MSTRLDRAKRLVELIQAENKDINKGKEGKPYGVKNADELLSFFAEYVQENQREVVTDEGKKVCIDAPLTVEGFCLWCGHSERWLDMLIHNISGKDTTERTADESELLRSATRVRDFCRNDLRMGAAQGSYNANIVARILGLADKQSVSETVRQIIVDCKEDKQDIEEIRDSDI